MQVKVKDHSVTVYFNSSVDLYDILNILLFYRQENRTQIDRILIKTRRGGIDWINDISWITKHPLIFIEPMLMRELRPEGLESTHILERMDELRISIEIVTLNRTNSEPQALTRKRLKQALFRDYSRRRF